MMWRVNLRAQLRCAETIANVFVNKGAAGLKWREITMLKCHHSGPRLFREGGNSAFELQNQCMPKNVAI